MHFQLKRGGNLFLSLPHSEGLAQPSQPRGLAQLSQSLTPHAPAELTPLVARSQALDRIIDNLRKPLEQTADRKAAPDFEVVNQGEVWMLGTKGNPEFPAEVLFHPCSGVPEISFALRRPPLLTVGPGESASEEQSASTARFSRD